MIEQEQNGTMCDCTPPKPIGYCVSCQMNRAAAARQDVAASDLEPRKKHDHSPSGQQKQKMKRANRKR